MRPLVIRSTRVILPTGVSPAALHCQDERIDRIADYDAAIELDGKRATALYGRGTAKLKKGDASGADDIAAAKKIKPDIASVFDQSGVK